MNSITVATLLLVGVVCCYALPGGLSDADTNSSEIQRVANFAVSELGAEYALEEIISAQTQVIAGLRTVITATVIRTGENMDETLTCELSVESRDWEGYEELVDFGCTPV